METEKKENKKQDTMDRESVIEKLAALVARKGSQEKAAKSLKGVSSASISLILSGRGGEVRDRMWQNIATQLEVSNEWQKADTVQYRQLSQLLDDAQEDHLVMSVIAPAGTGKTFTSKSYEEDNKEVYRLACSEFWSKNDFIDELLRSLGENGLGYSKKERINKAIEAIRRKQHPLLVFDEFDKLNDNVWFFFITLYNELEGKCGMVLLSTDSIEVRIKRGLRLNKRGYNEFWSRLGRRCVKLSAVDYEDIKAVCEANGESRASVIEDIVRDSEGDLRRVTRRLYGTKKAA